MKKFILGLAFISGLQQGAQAFPGVWKMVDSKEVAVTGVRIIIPQKYQTYTLNTGSLQLTLSQVSADPAQPTVVELPMPNGTQRMFKVWQTVVMAPTLAERYPEIKTFAGVAVDNGRVTARFDMTPSGFHAMIMDGSTTSFIDPYSQTNDGYYLCYYKHDYNKSVDYGMSCGVQDSREDELKKLRTSITGSGLPNVQLKVSGEQKKTYRLALACTAEYSAAVGGASPTKASVLAAMVTSMNRVNGVYERELSVTMQLVADNDKLIYLTAPDPYSNGSGAAMQDENQDNLDAVIGSANYDIGHVFSTGGGGIAEVGCVCNNSIKARGVTGRSKPTGDPFDLDYVAHEIGHQFGATHTFNATSGSCAGGNIDVNSSYEPGSGSTLMAYAGICSPNNIQNATSAYFHAKSLDQMSNFINDPFDGGSCPSTSASGNVPVVVPPFTKQYYIPYKTPFELTAPEAIDTDHDELTYCWEQYNLGNFGDFSNTNANGPLFRSFDPSASRTRIFPTLEKLLNNETDYLGEKLPGVARKLRFRLTVRDIKNGLGIMNFPDDSVVLDVVNTGTPFAVTAPNTNNDYWQIGTNVNITWDVASTTAAPINCSNVDILLSLDNGYTYTHTLATNTANDGSETIMVPADAATTSARVKVKGKDNVFFDISNAPFTINTWPASIGLSKDDDIISVYPIPAKDVLHLRTKGVETYHVTVVNTYGQLIHKFNMTENAILSLDAMTPGLYFLYLETKEGYTFYRSFVVR